MMRLFNASLFGLLLGLAGGLGYSWVIAPTQPRITPASLRADHQAHYIQLIAQTLAADQNLDRARARLTDLGEAGSAQAITALTQRMAGASGDAATVRALASLAAALGARPASPTPHLGPLATETAPPAPSLEPSATVPPTAAPASTPRPTFTPVPAASFEISAKQLVCDSQQAQPRLQVVTFDQNGNQLPGVEVVVEWDGGFDRFFTGLKPELGEGYGDFTMTPGVVYNLHLVPDPSASAAGLAIPDCPTTTGNYAGAWQLVFRQP